MINSLKSHFGVIFPLFVLLLALEFCLITSRVVRSYEASLNSDYSIIIVSAGPLPDVHISSVLPTFKSLTPLATGPVIERLKGEISAKNLAELTSALPNFYSLKLTALPSPAKLKSIQSELQKIANVKRVETFVKTHDQLHKMLVLAQNIFMVFTALIAILGFSLILKQMRIWLLEHRRRVEIMALFGAPFLMRASKLYKIAIFDTILATILALVATAVALAKVGSEVFGITIIKGAAHLVSDAPILFGLALGVSLICVTLVMNSAKK